MQAIYSLTNVADSFCKAKCVPNRNIGQIINYLKSLLRKGDSFLLSLSFFYILVTSVISVKFVANESDRPVEAHKFIACRIKVLLYKNLKSRVFDIYIIQMFSNIYT